MIDEELLEQLMKAVRVKSSIAEDEIVDLAEACKKELKIAGVYVINENDPLFKQAVKLYCKSHYGYDKNTEKFRDAFAALRDSMALSGDYARESEQGGRSGKASDCRK